MIIDSSSQLPNTSQKPNPKKPKISLKIEANQPTASSYSDPMYGIIFPYTPYPEQLKILRQIHLTLKTSSNALIQSPTGTGKTLCLLVGCLSYFYTTKLPSKIYYLTRTHSQINQIVNELKKTEYKCKVTVIGSRDTMCINRSLELFKGKALDKKCQEYCSKGMCVYNRSNSKQGDKNKKIEKYSQYSNLPVLNIQQLKELGLKQGFCPYYLSRQKQQESEVVIMTYNYFLCYNLFTRNTFSIKDSVIIFDQAHNVDQISQEGCSVQIGGEILERVVKSLKEYIKGFEKYSQNKLLKKQKQIQKVHNFFSLIDNLNKELERESKNRILEGFTSFMTYLNDAMKANKNGLFTRGLTINTFKDLCVVGKQVAYWMKAENQNYFSLEELISNFEDIRSIISSSLSEKQQKIFQISIFKQNQKTKILFLCLSASFIFSKIHQKKPRSILLASGTLKPLNYWQQQIGLKFYIKLSTQSFINQTHLYSQVVPSYKGKQFDFSYNKRMQQDQIQNLLCFVSDLCNMVSSGGIIVAFSTYEIMQLALQLYNPCNFKYKVFWQSKGCTIEQLIQDYSQEARRNGAILFMVMRGKFAEGIDFHDELCRAMVVVGIPFAPISDPKLEAKKRFMNTLNTINSSDNKVSINNPSFINASSEITSVSYDEWYVIQAIRVVNQAIGRVIRHIGDYGCVFLLDKKYQKGYIKEYLPEWLVKCFRPSFSSYTICNFFKRLNIAEQVEKVKQRKSEKMLIIQDNEIKKQQSKQQFKEKAKCQQEQQMKEAEQMSKQDFLFKTQTQSQHKTQTISKPKKMLSKFQEITQKRERKTYQISDTIKKQPEHQILKIESCINIQTVINVKEQSLSSLLPFIPEKQVIAKNFKKRKDLSGISFKRYSPPKFSKHK